ncbi:Carboxypeptidase regulatory-like domain-containing protein [Halorientalis persicus]|uniref:Carboxypeptidase regulatory-like domain-containing protein n=1 Tax=Halorientalis persicus TaxID=1367881 RepID=A0A1H8WAS0_9EURY|nr:carboxypeptidase regulatory-like domain-containing protein [Halorientalis persicus]SEP24527.1 Carboxypeptidase regulatory-like domain-containing protein [Halorientalis persicus]
MVSRSDIRCPNCGHPVEAHPERADNYSEPQNELLYATRCSSPRCKYHSSESGEPTRIPPQKIRNAISEATSEEQSGLAGLLSTTWTALSDEIGRLKDALRRIRTHRHLSIILFVVVALLLLTALFGFGPSAQADDDPSNQIVVVDTVDDWVVLRYNSEYLVVGGFDSYRWYLAENGEYYSSPSYYSNLDNARSAIAEWQEKHAADEDGYPKPVLATTTDPDATWTVEEVGSGYVVAGELNNTIRYLHPNGSHSETAYGYPRTKDAEHAILVWGAQLQQFGEKREEIDQTTPRDDPPVTTLPPVEDPPNPDQPDPQVPDSSPDSPTDDTPTDPDTESPPESATPPDGSETPDDDDPPDGTRTPIPIEQPDNGDIDLDDDDIIFGAATEESLPYRNTISGTIRRPNTAPLGNVEVRLMNSSGTRTTTTTSGGTYRFRNVSAGDYQLTAVPPVASGLAAPEPVGVTMNDQGVLEIRNRTKGAIYFTTASNTIANNDIGLRTRNSQPIRAIGTGSNISAPVSYNTSVNADNATVRLIPGYTAYRGTLNTTTANLPQTITTTGDTSARRAWVNLTGTPSVDPITVRGTYVEGQENPTVNIRGNRHPQNATIRLYGDVIETGNTISGIATDGDQRSVIINGTINPTGPGEDHPVIRFTGVKTTEGANYTIPDAASRSNTSVTIDGNFDAENVTATLTGQRTVGKNRTIIRTANQSSNETRVAILGNQEPVGNLSGEPVVRFTGLGGEDQQTYQYSNAAGTTPELVIKGDRQPTNGTLTLEGVTVEELMNTSGGPISNGTQNIVIRGNVAPRAANNTTAAPTIALTGVQNTTAISQQGTATDDSRPILSIPGNRKPLNSTLTLRGIRNETARTISNSTTSSQTYTITIEGNQPPIGPQNTSQPQITFTGGLTSQNKSYQYNVSTPHTQTVTVPGNYDPETNTITIRGVTTEDPTSITGTAANHTINPQISGNINSTGPDSHQEPTIILTGVENRTESTLSEINISSGNTLTRSTTGNLDPSEVSISIIGNETKTTESITNQQTTIGKSIPVSISGNLNPTNESLTVIGETETNTRNLSIQNAQSGETATIDIGGNLAPTGANSSSPVVTFTGNEIDNKQSIPGQQISNNERIDVQIGGNLPPTDASVTIKGETSQTDKSISRQNLKSSSTIDTNIGGNYAPSGPKNGEPAITFTGHEANNWKSTALDQGYESYGTHSLRITEVHSHPDGGVIAVGWRNWDGNWRDSENDEIIVKHINENGDLEWVYKQATYGRGNHKDAYISDEGEVYLAYSYNPIVTNPSGKWILEKINSNGQRVAKERHSGSKISNVDGEVRHDMEIAAYPDGQVVTFDKVYDSGKASLNFYDKNLDHKKRIPKTPYSELRLTDIAVNPDTRSVAVSLWGSSQYNSYSDVELYSKSGASITTLRPDGRAYDLAINDNGTIAAASSGTIDPYEKRKRGTVNIWKGSGADRVHKSKHINPNTRCAGSTDVSIEITNSGKIVASEFVPNSRHVSDFACDSLSTLTTTFDSDLNRINKFTQSNSINARGIASAHTAKGPVVFSRFDIGIDTNSPNRTTVKQYGTAVTKNPRVDIDNDGVYEVAAQGELSEGESITKKAPSLSPEDDTWTVKTDDYRTSVNAKWTARTATANPQLDIDSDGSSEVNHEGLLKESEQITRSIPLSQSDTSWQFDSSGANPSFSAKWTERTGTENPEIDLGNTGTIEINSDQILSDGEKITKEVPGLETSDDVWRIRTSGAPVDITGNWVERTATKNPRVDINGDGQPEVSHSGLLQEGETHQANPNLSLSDTSWTITGSGPSPRLSANWTARTGTENPRLDFGETGTVNVRKQAVLSESESVVLNSDDFTKDVSNIRFITDNGRGTVRIDYTRRNTTEAPSVRTSGNGGTDINIQGQLDPNKTVTRKIPTLGPKTSKIKINTRRGNVKYNISFKERTATENPQLTVNGNSGTTVGYNGILRDGETISRPLQGLVAGKNTITSSTNAGRVAYNFSVAARNATTNPKVDIGADGDVDSVIDQTVKPGESVTTRVGGLRSGSQPVRIMTDRGAANWTLSYESVLLPENISVTANSSTSPEAQYQGILLSNETSKQAFPVDPGANQLDWSLDRGAVNWTWEGTGRTHAENVTVTASNGSATAQASVSGILPANESAVRSLSGLGHGNSTLDVTAESGAVNYTLRYNATNITEDPVVDIDDTGVSNVEYDGLLPDGETRTYNVTYPTGTVPLITNTTAGEVNISGQYTQQNNTENPCITVADATQSTCSSSGQSVAGELEPNETAVVPLPDLDHGTNRLLAGTDRGAVQYEVIYRPVNHTEGGSATIGGTTTVASDEILGPGESRTYSLPSLAATNHDVEATAEASDFNLSLSLDEAFTTKSPEIDPDGDGQYETGVDGLVYPNETIEREVTQATLSTDELGFDMDRGPVEYAFSYINRNATITPAFSIDGKTVCEAEGQVEDSVACDVPRDVLDPGPNTLNLSTLGGTVDYELEYHATAVPENVTISLGNETLSYPEDFNRSGPLPLNQSNEIGMEFTDLGLGPTEFNVEGGTIDGIETHALVNLTYHNRTRYPRNPIVLVTESDGTRHVQPIPDSLLTGETLEEEIIFRLPRDWFSAGTNRVAVVTEDETVITAHLDGGALAARNTVFIGEGVEAPYHDKLTNTTAAEVQATG